MHDRNPLTAGLLRIEMDAEQFIVEFEAALERCAMKWDRSNVKVTTMQRKERG